MMTNSKPKILWLAAWLVFDVIASVLAFISGGAGHGNYVVCKLLFPIPIFIGFLQEQLGLVATILLLIVALIQYPLVGVAPFVLSPRRLKYFYIVFVALHVLFVAIVFMYPSTQYG